MRSIAIVVMVAAQVAVAQVEPVEIVGAQRRPDPRAVAAVAADDAGGAPVAALAGVLVALAAAGGAGWWTWRRWSGLDDAERAFLMLCLRRGVRHKDRRRLRERAQAQGVSPVAALLVTDR